MKITIKKVGLDREVETGNQFLKVDFDIVDTVQKEGEEAQEVVVTSLSHGFAPDITKEDLQAELGKVLATFVSDRKIAEDSKRSEELNTNADTLNKELSGTQITN